MEQGVRREVLKMILATTKRVEEQAALSVGVQANHTLVSLPNTTTAITTGATALPGTSITLTAKQAGVMNSAVPGARFRVLIMGAINALNTLQAVITPTISFTANGINTTTANGTLVPFALPGNTSSPMVGMMAEICEVSNTLWAAGQTVTATLSLTGSVTGGSAPIGSVSVSMQEIF